MSPYKTNESGDEPNPTLDGQLDLLNDSVCA